MSSTSETGFQSKHNVKVMRRPKHNVNVMKVKKVRKKIGKLFSKGKDKGNKQGLLDEEDNTLKRKKEKKSAKRKVVPRLNFNRGKAYACDLVNYFSLNRRQDTQLLSYPVKRPTRSFANDFANALTFNRRQNKKMLTLADTLSEVSPCYSAAISFDSDFINDLKIGTSMSSTPPSRNSCENIIRNPMNLLKNLKLSLEKKDTKKKNYSGLFDIEGNRFPDDMSLSSFDSFEREKKGIDR